MFYRCLQFVHVRSRLDFSTRIIHLKFLEIFFKDDMVCNSEVLIIWLVTCVGKFCLDCCRCIGVRSIHVVVYKQVSVFKQLNKSFSFESISND